jgi:manganese/zinc/iron transport system permease protein
MLSPAAISAESTFWPDFWHISTYQVAWGSNTAVAMRGSTVLGLACGAVGAFLLLRRRSLVADALSHAALPGVCVAFLLTISLGAGGRSLPVLLAGAAVFGLLGVACVHLLSRISRVKEDAAIGSVLSVFFALGIVLLGVIQDLPVGGKAGLNQFIFGQAASMTARDANLIAIVALIVLAVAAIAFKELRLLCFDAAYARGIGWSATALDGLLLAMITTLTVIGLHAVGAILMVALLIIPPAAARFWTDRLTVMLCLSAALGALACHIGAAASAAMANLPTGPAIVVACGGLFIISMMLAPRRGVMAHLWQRWRLKRIVARQHLLRAMFENEEISGGPDRPIPVADLLQRRAWSRSDLDRIIRRALRRGELQPLDGGFTLTDSGRRAAARIVRTHRLWEHFLTTQADIAPSHVDRAADDIEHVLSEELIRDLEAELRLSGALSEAGFVPRSAHALKAAGARS